MPIPCFINSTFYPDQDAAAFPYNDLGLHRAFAVFDYCRTRHGVPFKLDRYLDRFYSSAKQLGLTVPVGRECIQERVRTLLDHSAAPETGVRFLLTAGAMDGEAPCQANLAISLDALPLFGVEVYKQGIALMTHEYAREFPEVKTTNYLQRFLLKQQLEECGAMEVLYHKEGWVTECAHCNVFAIKDRKVLTPAEGILPGITRQLVIELCQELHMDLEIAPLSLETLLLADECFITSSKRNLMPVVKVDGHPIGNGNVGPHTQSLMEAFFNLEPAIAPHREGE